MLTGVRRLGHSIPPTFVVFPLGILSTSIIFDFVNLMTAREIFSELAYWMVLGGLTGGVAVTILGFVDWLMLANGSRAKKRALVHLIAYSFVLVVYAASALLRTNDPAKPEIAATFLATFGACIALFGATLGAELAGKREEYERNVFDHPDILTISGGSDRL